MPDGSNVSPDPALSRWMVARLESLRAERASAAEALRAIQAGLGGTSGGADRTQPRIESLTGRIARLDHALAQWDGATAHIR
ncbi:MAG: hypothetical protein H0X27_00350 [Caulobacteraceae bacterium]|nr:hypothetical protein [Caulobacteraceae bacterium]